MTKQDILVKWLELCGIMSVSERELENIFDEYFEEAMPLVVFGPLSYAASKVLKTVDPVAYRQEFINWLDSESDYYREIGGETYRVEDLKKALIAFEDALEF